MLFSLDGSVIWDSGCSVISKSMAVQRLERFQSVEYSISLLNGRLRHWWRFFFSKFHHKLDGGWRSGSVVRSPNRNNFGSRSAGQQFSGGEPVSQSNYVITSEKQACRGTGDFC